MKPCQAGGRLSIKQLTTVIDTWPQLRQQESKRHAQTDADQRHRRDQQRAIRPSRFVRHARRIDDPEFDRSVLLSTSPDISTVSRRANKADHSFA
jgi:hypothetical protein